MSRLLPLVALVPLVGSLAAVAVTTSAEELPNRRPGLWEMKMTLEGGQVPPQVMQQCIDATTDQEMRQPPGMEGVDLAKACKQDVTRTGDTMTAESNCTVNGHTTKSRMTITGSFESAYSMKVAVSGDQPGRSEMHMTMDGKYLGACKADQKPGDMMMGNMKINISDLKKMRGGQPGGGMAQPPQR
jgi:hypothetical protein